MSQHSIRSCPMPLSLYRIAIVYLLIGVGIAVYMVASHDVRYRGIHVHANLLGWVTLALAAGAYQMFPAMQESVLARIHYWLHNIGLPPGLLGYAISMNGHREIGGPVAGLGMLCVIVGIGALAINLFRHGGRASSWSPRS
jgi:cbb3-type cytochrome oxidase subunit 1